jgi:hypothetical protein
MTAGRDWQLYGDEYGRMKFGNGHFETLFESKNGFQFKPGQFSKTMGYE